MSSARIGFMTFAAVCGIASILNASDWTQFRGPQGDWQVPELSHPDSWSDTENLAWAVELAGSGGSSPIVVGDRVFVTMAISEAGTKPLVMTQGVRNMQSMGLGGKKPTDTFQFAVSCLNLNDGTLVWQKSLEQKIPPHAIHPSNSFATESPATDGERLFVYFGAIGLVAGLDLDGNELWRRDVGTFKTGNDFGTGSSFMVDEGLVYLQYDNDEKSMLLAFDATTGNDVGKKDRDYKTALSSPLVWRNLQRKELIVCGEGNVTSYNARTGEEFWKLTGIPSSSVHLRRLMMTVYSSETADRSAVVRWWRSETRARQS